MTEYSKACKSIHSLQETSSGLPPPHLHFAQTQQQGGNNSPETEIPPLKNLKAQDSLEPEFNAGCFHLLESNLLSFLWGMVPLSLCEVLMRLSITVSRLPEPQDSSGDRHWPMAPSPSQDT